MGGGAGQKRRAGTWGHGVMGQGCWAGGQRWEQGSRGRHHVTLTEPVTCILESFTRHDLKMNTEVDDHTGTQKNNDEGEYESGSERKTDY